MEKVEFDALIDQIKGQLPEAVAKIIAEKGLKMEDVEKTLAEKSISKTDFEEFKTIMNNAVVELKNEREKTPIVKTASEEIKEKKETLKKIAKGDTQEIELKALTNRAAVDGNTQSYNLPDIGQLATRQLTLTSIFPTIKVGESNNNGVIKYWDWDEATKVRAAAMIAEGGTFPQSTAKFKEYILDFKKVGDTLAVTEEFFEDEAMFAAELQSFLVTNVDIEVENELATGDGTGNHLTGIIQSSPEYALPSVGTLQDANIFDLIVNVKGQITTSKGSKYTPNVVLAPFGTIAEMLSKKDLNNNYIVPSFATIVNGNITVAGMPVIECNVLDGEVGLIVCDRRFAKIYERIGTTISKGYSGTQFVEDAMTLKVRKRLLFLIRTADKGGFLKVTNITAAIAALTA